METIEEATPTGGAVAVAAGSRAGDVARLVVFTAAVFVAAALLFVIQPMVAKMLLPAFGGGPSIWNTSMVFFQAALLGGYLYAHISTTRLGARRQPLSHVAVMAAPLVALPFVLPVWAGRLDVAPEVGLLAALLVMVGLPFFVVSTMGPLLQRWFSWTGDPRAHDPYFLYAASNAGSLLGLVSYPLLIEPRLTLGAQAAAWTAGYGLLLVLALTCALVVTRNVRRHPMPEATPDVLATAIALTRRLKWIGLALVPSGLMLAVTMLITTDIAPVPLLWVVPLGIYLASFIVAFTPSMARFVRELRRPTLVLAPTAVLMLAFVGRPPDLGVAAVHLLVLALVSTAVHGKLAEDRPDPSGLTSFYLALSVGGVLGGAFVALVAPVVFNDLVEYPILVAAGLAALVTWEGRLGLRSREGIVRGALVALLPVAVAATAFWAPPSGSAAVRGLSVVALGVAVGVAVLFASRVPAPFVLGMSAALAVTVIPTESSLLKDRTFFGIHRVAEDGSAHVLYHGTTMHGWQEMAGEARTVPAAYYHPEGPAGDIMGFSRDGGRSIALVGLGTGALAAYGEPGDEMTIYEIDPTIVEIATTSGLFTYVPDSAAETSVVVGDGRLRLADSPNSYDLVVLDAFSSDAIPAHLMTREAMETYLEKSRPGGVVAFHISNRNLDLRPVLAAIAEELALPAAIRADAGPGRASSAWVVVARDDEALARFAADERWSDLLDATADRVLWTDDHSNVLSVIRSW